VVNWFQLGIALRLECSTLEKIRSNHRDIDRCMTDMLASWLQGQTTPSWRALVDGLASQSVNEKDAAMKVAMKHGKDSTLC